MEGLSCLQKEADRLKNKFTKTFYGIVKKAKHSTNSKDRQVKAVSNIALMTAGT